MTNPIDIGKRIKFAREERALTQEQLGQKLGMNKSTIQRYENGIIKTIKLPVIEAMAKVLEVNPDWLICKNEIMEPTQEQTLFSLPQENIYLIPIYDSVAAGFGVIAQDCVVSYLPTYLSCSSEKDKYLWVNVKGDSMAPLIDDGSKILIKKQTSVDSGSIAVVLIDDEEAVVKKVIYGDTWVELHSANPYYPPRRFEDSELEKIQILGLVKEVSKSL